MGTWVSHQCISSITTFHPNHTLSRIHNPHDLLSHKRPSRTDRHTSIRPIRSNHTLPLLRHGRPSPRRGSRRRRQRRRRRHDGGLAAKHGDGHVEDVRRLCELVHGVAVGVDGRELAGDSAEEAFGRVACLLQDVGDGLGEAGGVEEGLLREEVAY